MADKNFKIKTGLTLPQPLPADQGGTGQSTLTNALNALLPAQTSAANKVLQTDGTNTTWTTLPTGYTKGSTASRPSPAAAGDLYFNTDNNYFESYTTNGWFPIAAAPGIPTSVVATDVPSGRAYNNGKASVAFSLASGAGAPTSLIVTPSPTTSPTTFTGSTSPILVTGLASSTQYTYTVSATSPYGTSAASSASSGVTATSVPQAPTIGAVTAGNALATVAYTAGATGGATATFTATSTPGSLTGTGTSPITVSGLTNGTSYTFAVTATNANGTSAASAASSAVVPTEISVVGAYDALATVTVPTGGLSSVTFAGIPSGYKHLQIRAMLIGTNAAQTGSTSFQFNADGGSNYTRHQLGGGGATAFAYAITSETKGHIYGYNDNLNNVVPMSFIMDVLDYANTNKYKTTKVLSGSDRNGTSPYGDINLVSSLWLNTNAITSLSVFVGGQNMGQYSKIALYGVK